MLQFAGELRVCTRAAYSRKPSIERGVEHLVQVCGCDKVEVGSDVCWKLLQVFLVAFREDDALHSCPVCSQHLVLNPAHLQRTGHTCLSKLEWTRDDRFMCVYYNNLLAAQALLT